MKLSELIRALPSAEVVNPGDAEIHEIVSDSRRAQAGDLFVAYPGVAVDGHRFIPQAVAQGAAAVVAENAEMQTLLAARGIPLIRVPNGREALSHLAAAWHGFPSRRLTVIGVTGTDGKTTTATLICSILQTAGFETGLISTVAAFIGEHYIDTGFHTTTPDAPDVQNYLAKMVEAGARCAVIESTSIGLAQYRLAAVDYDVAVMTNITPEHYDHHHSFEQYRAAKAMLFQNLLTSARKPGVRKVAVLNADDPSCDYMAAIHSGQPVRYGVRQPADITAEQIRHSPTGLSFVAHTPEEVFEVQSPLIGHYNVSNILAAIGATYAHGFPVEAMQMGVRRVRTVPGRMERILAGQPFTVMVDFAHTPNALEQALTTARALTQGTLTVVFGCAGRRDPFKRPLMGEIAGRLADRIVITAEDPRTESLEAITQQIAEGCERAGRREGTDYFKIGDRQEAIAFALRQARPGDLVIITGKGHERSMCFGDTEYPWSDQEAVKKALA